jgi:hypothetical protein
MLKQFFYALPFGVLLSSSAFSGERMVVGGDTYVSGSSVTLTDPSPRDALLSGFTVDVSGKVEKDVTAAGFNVDIDAPVGRDVYAAGFSVDVTQPVTEDLSAAGFNIHVGNQATIGGNARLAAGTIVIDAPVSGSLVAAGGSLTINGIVSGDARLTSNNLSFGKDAKINGVLTYYATAPITIPASVIAADRVHFEKLEVANAVNAVSETMRPDMPRFWPAIVTGIISAFALTIAFLVAFAAILFAFAPNQMELWKEEALKSPIKTIVFGVLGLSMTVGLVPVGAMTLIGIPFVPIAILAAIVFWIVGYIIGAYAFVWKIVSAFRAPPTTNLGRLFALALGFICIAALNFIPIIGWLFNLAIVFLGLGAIIFQAARKFTLPSA